MVDDICKSKDEFSRGKNLCESCFFIGDRALLKFDQQQNLFVELTYCVIIIADTHYYDTPDPSHSGMYTQTHTRARAHTNA